MKYWRINEYGKLTERVWIAVCQKKLCFFVKNLWTFIGIWKINFFMKMSSETFCKWSVVFLKRSVYLVLIVYLKSIHLLYFSSHYLTIVKKWMHCNPSKFSRLSFYLICFEVPWIQKSVIWKLVCVFVCMWFCS